MSNMHMVNSLIEWERRIQAEESKRRYYRIEPFFNRLSDNQPATDGKKNFFERLFSREQKHQPDAIQRKEKPCKGVQPC